MQRRYLRKSVYGYRFYGYRFCGAVCAIGLSGLVLSGCGGGSGSGTSVPQGNAGVRAIAIAADQSLAGGRAFPLAAVLDTAPTGSVFTRAAQAHGKTLRTRAGGGTLVFDPSDGLYKTYTITGNTEAVAYYTDAAGTKSAGTASMTIVGATNFDTAYATYPVTVNFTANVTGGTLPFNGSGTVIFTDATGANSLTGKFTLPLNHVVVSGKLSLDSNSNVSGSVDVQESGATLHVTNIAGNLNSDLTGAITSDPYGWKGTGTFNLQTGQFSITLATGTGTATASSDASGTLTLHFADGTSQTITSPLTSTLAGTSTGTGTGTGGGSTGGTGSATYNAPVALVLPAGADNLASPEAVTSSGVVLGLVGISTGNVAVAWTNPTNPVILQPVPATGDTFTLAQAGNATQIVGGSGGSNYAFTPAVWTGTNYAPQALQKGSTPVALATSINAGGQIVGAAGSGASTGHNRLTIGLAIFDDAQALYWSSASAAPVILTPLVTGGSADAIGINNSGQIVGYAYNAAGTVVPVFWSSPTATPTAIPMPSGAASVALVGIDNAGQLAGYSLTGTAPNNVNAKPLFWSSPTATPTPLALPTGATVGAVNGISGNGTIVGSANLPDGTHAVVWKNQQPEDLTDTLPTGSKIFLEYGQAVNDSGQILAFGIGSTNMYFTLTPK